MMLFASLYLASEIAALFVFRALRKYYLGSTASLKPVLNGVVERLFLHLSLVAGFHHALTLFGALKVGTRIRSEESKISNDYFLIGNLISAGLVILTISVWNYFK